MLVEQSSASIDSIWTKKNIALMMIIIFCFILSVYARGLDTDQIGIIGFLPILALAVLTVVGLDIVLAVIVAILLSVVMTC